MILLKFFALVLLVMLLMAVVFFWNIIKTFFHLFRQVKRGLGGEEAAQNTYRGQNRRHQSDHESVIDRRSPEEANQKIFSKDEGEYVDYTEE